MRNRTARAATARAGCARTIPTGLGTAQRRAAAAAPACPAPPATYPTKTTRRDFRRAFDETRVRRRLAHYPAPHASTLLDLGEELIDQVAVTAGWSGR